MKKFILALSLSLLILGCDKETLSKPPKLIGNGSVFLFDNTWGKFEHKLNDFLLENPNARVMSVTGIEDGNGTPRKYLVVIQYFNGNTCTTKPIVPEVTRINDL